MAGPSEHIGKMYVSARFGSYGDKLSPQYSKFIMPLKSGIVTLAKSIPVTEENRVFTIGDYGAADGTTSIALMKEIICCLKEKYGENFPIQVIYEDQPINDFNLLFKRIHGLISSCNSYLSDFKNVYTLASGSNFYTQCVPDNTMDIITCFIASHWLSKRGTVYQKSLYRCIDCSRVEEAALQKKAEKDWEKFLILRAKELRTGGFLVISTPSQYHESSTGEFKWAGSGLFCHLNNLWREYRDTAKITENEFVNTNFDFCFRSQDELLAPFKQENSTVRKAGLRLKSYDLKICDDVFYETWRNTLDHDGIDDRLSFARNFVNAHRCWSNSTFLDGLSDSRTSQEKEALVDELFVELERRIAEDSPEKYKDSHIVAYVIIQKF